MAKELPYFKFFVSEWIGGDITLCSMDAQGVFANIMAHYWNKNCTMTLANAKQRFSKYVASIEELLFQQIIKLDEDGNIIINFLDEQMNEFSNVSEKRAIAGKIGGLAKAKQMSSKALAKHSNIEKRKIRVKKSSSAPKISFKPPNLEEVKSYFKQNGYSVITAGKAFDYYESANWHDSKGNKIKNWKQKMIGVWFKDENKTQSSSGPIITDISYTLR